MPWQETNSMLERHHFAQDLASGHWTMTELCDRYRHQSEHWLQVAAPLRPGGRARAARSEPRGGAHTLRLGRAEDLEAPADARSEARLARTEHDLRHSGTARSRAKATGADAVEASRCSGAADYPVLQCLIGRTLTPVDRLRSRGHTPWPCGTARRFLRAHPQMTAVEVPDTGDPVRALTLGWLAADAVIGGTAAARIYKATVLLNGVDDAEANSTEFALITCRGFSTANRPIV
jgi:hypothetical protein